MDQGTQEEVRPAYSYADKSRIVSTFVKSRFKVNSYYQVSNLLNQNFLHPLSNLPFRISPTYTTEEGGKYFDWLVAVCTGAVQADEKYLRIATEQLFTFLQFMKHDITVEKDPFATPSIESRLDALNDLITSLFRELENRYGKTSAGMEKIASMDGRLAILSEQLKQISKDMEARDKRIDSEIEKLVDVVEKFNLLTKTYGPTWEQAKRDYEATAGKIGGRTPE
jgi:hypothetical protein